MLIQICLEEGLETEGRAPPVFNVLDIGRYRLYAGLPYYPFDGYGCYLSIIDWYVLLKKNLD